MKFLLDDFIASWTLYWMTLNFLLDDFNLLNHGDCSIRITALSEYLYLTLVTHNWFLYYDFKLHYYRVLLSWLTYLGTDSQITSMAGNHKFLSYDYLLTAGFFPVLGSLSCERNKILILLLWIIYFISKFWLPNSYPLTGFSPISI